MQVIEDDPRYWEVMSSALSVGWLDIVVSKVSCISDIFFCSILCSIVNKEFVLSMFSLAGENAAVAWILPIRSAQ